MNEDTRTRAQLIEALDASAERERALEARIPSAPRRVPEADALASCIRALDDLDENSRRSSSYGYGQRSEPSVHRVLKALGVKYGVPEVERVPEPCARRHVEDITMADIVGSVRAVEGGVFVP